jgi:alkaline phosphatase
MQAELTKQYGTVIDCGFDYYNQRYMKVIENHVTDTLGKISGDEDGFFLMYEEAHIDKKSSKNDIEGTFLALIRFNQVIARFMEFAFYHPETAVIITADHETGGLHPDEDGSLSFVDSEHTAANVPVFAWGVGMDFFNSKTVENIDIPKRLASLWGVEDFGDRSNNWFDAIYGDDEEFLTPPDSFN